MSVSPHDFPDRAAQDADPNTIPLGPQAPGVQSDLSGRFACVTGVEQTILQQSRRRGRGPLEIVLLSEDDNVAGVRSTIRGNLSSLLPAGYVGDVRESPVGSNQAVPRDATIAGSVLVWRHPLLPHIEGVLNDHGLVYDFRVHWDETASGLSLCPATTSWSDLEPLYVVVSGPREQLDSVMDDVMGSTISSVPRPSVTTVTQYSADDAVSGDASDLPDGVALSEGERALQLQFTDRELVHDPASGVYNLPAEELSGVVEHAVSKRRETLRSSGESQDSETGTMEEGVQLTITSPPYLDAIDYDAYAAGNGKDWSRKHGVAIDGADETTAEDELVELWKAQQREIFEQVYEATREGGYCAVVIGHVKMDDGKWVPLPHEFSSVMRDIGWEFHERIIWRKIGSRASRFGTTIQHPKPTYYYPNQVHEEIMIWRKGDIDRRKEPREELEISPLMKQEIANNVWHIPTVPHNKGVNHPCPFPEEIVHRLTLLFSYPGDVVVDPMTGSGTTVKVADRLDRIGIGTELQSAFVAEARRRLSAETYERGEQILPSFTEHVPGDSPEAAMRTPAVSEMEFEESGPCDGDDREEIVADGAEEIRSATDGGISEETGSDSENPTAGEETDDAAQTDLLAFER